MKLYPVIPDIADYFFSVVIRTVVNDYQFPTCIGLPADAFNSFARYYAEHPEVFTTALLDRIKETATSINALFPVHNPKKKDHFGDLLIMLRKKPNIANS